MDKKSDRLDFENFVISSLIKLYSSDGSFIGYLIPATRKNALPYGPYSTPERALHDVKHLPKTLRSYFKWMNARFAEVS